MEIKNKDIENIDSIDKNLKNKIIRDFENTKYYGYMFYIEYKGTKFQSFDENKGMISVKSEFKKILELNNIKFYKGIQQAGRTDADVSALNNILYINSKQNIVFEKLKYIELDGIKIKKIIKTLPQLEFPKMIEKRYYKYEYPKDKIKNNSETITKKCLELSGERDYREFTSKKGEKLKNHIRNIEIRYDDGILYFEGDSFLPHQVRIMSNVILNNCKKQLDGKYLTLDKVKLSNYLENILFKKIDDIKIEKVLEIEKNNLFYIFYVNKKNKSEIIGTKGKNIKKLKKIYGDIVIKEIE